MERPNVLSRFGLVVLSIATPLCGQFVYAVNGSKNVSAYSVTVTGALKPIATSVPAGAFPGFAAVTPSGKFLYLVQEVSTSILGYAINAATGALTPIPGSPFPANVTAAVAVDPTGKFLYSFGYEGSEVGVVGFTIDASTGALAPIAGSPFAPASVTTPFAIAADPQGRFLYELTEGANTGISSISAFTINSSTGALTLVSGSPFAAGNFASGLTVDPRGRFAYTAEGIFPGSGLPPFTVYLGYTINDNTGALTAIPDETSSAPGAVSSSITVDPSGRFAYVPGGANGAPITSYAIDPDSGVLTAVPNPPSTPEAYTPETLYLDPTGQFAYVFAFSGSVGQTPTGNTIPYSIDTTTGMLAALPSGIYSGTSIVAVAPFITVPLAVSVTPNSGSGANHTFTFEYSDSRGYSSLNIVYAGFGRGLYTEKSCRVEYRRAANKLYLENDDGSSFSGPVTPGVAGTISNSQCTLDAGGSSVSGSGYILTLNLAVSFKPAFAGAQVISMYAIDQSGLKTPGRQNVGTWDVTPGTE